jgi:hypothetical protein
MLKIWINSFLLFFASLCSAYRFTCIFALSLHRHLVTIMHMRTGNKMASYSLRSN